MQKSAREFSDVLDIHYVVRTSKLSVIFKILNRLRSLWARIKDGGRTGIFDRPAFVLQATLGNIEVIEERSEFINIGLNTPKNAVLL